MALTTRDCGTWLRENKPSPVANLTTLKLICSTHMTAVYVKISGIVEEVTVCRCAANGFSRALNFSATGGQTSLTRLDFWDE